MAADPPAQEGDAAGQTIDARAAAGDPAALAELFSRYRHRLGLAVRLRMDRRLQGRIDPSDVLQETYLEASQRLGEYAHGARKMPLFLWLRFLTLQRLLIVHRRHLGAKMRNAAGEVSLYRGSMPETSTESLAAQLLGQLTSPSEAAIRAELQLQLQQALNTMDAVDREVLALRHFEELTNAETAEVLGISKTAASNRYVAALARLREILAAVPGLLDRNATNNA